MILLRQSPSMSRPTVCYLSECRLDFGCPERVLKAELMTLARSSFLLWKEAL